MPLKSPIKFNPSKGIASSPLNENAFSIGIDNSTIRGVARINTATTERHEASGTFTDAVNFINDVMVGGGGDIWTYNEGNSNFDLLVDTAKGTSDFCVWKDYYILTRQANRLDAVSFAGVETNISSARGDVCISGSDGVVYFGYNNLVRTLREPIGQTFDPTNNATYQVDNNALDLPSDEVITTLAELGSFILIGCESGKLYLWDRVSSSFELPTEVPGAVKMLIPVISVAYVVLSSGDIYVTNGSSVQLVNEFPAHILDEPDKNTFDLYPNAYRVSGQKMYIGLGTVNNGINPSGVYSYDFSSGEFKVEFICSNGKTGDTTDNKIAVTAIQNTGDTFFIGFEDADSPIIDQVKPYQIGGTDRYTGYVAKSISPMYRIGTDTNKETLKHHSIYLAKRLPEDCSVRLSYRTTINGNWNVIGTVTGGSIEEKTFNKTIDSLTKIQFMVEMDTGSDQTPEIINIESI